MQTMIVDLKEATEYLDQYIELRNSYTDVLLTQPVWLKSTEEWLKKNRDVEIRAVVNENKILLGVVILYLHRNGEVAICISEKRRGIGSRLLVEIEEVARLRSLPSIWAWVLAENSMAQKFFEKHGYIHVANNMRSYNHKMRNGIKYQKTLLTREPS